MNCINKSKKKKYKIIYNKLLTIPDLHKSLKANQENVYYDKQ